MADSVLVDAAQQAGASLGAQGVDALLLHAPADLHKPGAHYLKTWLLSLRERGLVQRLGVSIYAAEDLEGVDPGLLDLVQLPLSLFDQRLLQDGTLARLRAAGTSIHPRSLYLQGLLLTPGAKWPPWISTEMRAHQLALEALSLERGCRLIDLSLGFARHQEDLEAVVIGVCSSHELAELSAAWLATPPLQKIEWGSWALNDQIFLDPRRWPNLCLLLSSVMYFFQGRETPGSSAINEINRLPILLTIRYCLCCWNYPLSRDLAQRWLKWAAGRVGVSRAWLIIETGRSLA